jgi:murein DD-endopeptidase MepM/ murein hydrolase activator NlpD
MRRVIAAASLAERIDAQRRLAAAEREVLVREIARIRDAQAAARARAAELQQRLAERRAALERIVEETYRASRVSTLEVLLRRGSLVDVLVHVDDLGRLSAQQRDAVEQLRDTERRLKAEQDALAQEESEIGRLGESVAAKDATLARLAARADALAGAARFGAAAVNDAEVDLLRELADQAAREHEEADRLIAQIAKRSGEPLPALDRWSWPASGQVSQEFGPTALALEPPLVYRGLPYPHFHDGIDIAAALGAPVRAVARGRVAFVGHLPGGAMVVIIAHDGGLLSLYGHLDDTVLRPTVRAGDTVEAGQRIGSIGLTGLTTGPHLHFSLRQGTEPLDPRTRLP